ncbi:MAG TPA: 16S rRNA (cytidine(1402)-2'-O)-methyltransferase [Steroidobacteraceae bacterium]|nr:16S rRNA (cytidine(1402)-2'-O)-methyltransferase [Steroidobacteraceae bacterium]
MTNEAAGRLYVVATPIGNLGDLSARACETLKSCALIAAEDTRRTGLLLKAAGIATPMVSLHDHNEARRAPELIARLRAGASIALVSDAGTPAISDPGFELVRACAAAGLEVIAVPGPCALIAALSIAALPTDRFCFEGFLPARGAARRARLAALSTEERTLVFYESPHRLEEMLADCAQCFGAERGAALARELTKLHETLYRGPLGALAERARADADLSRGELVLVIAGAAAAAPALGEDGHGGALDRALKPLLAQLPLKQAAQLAAQIASVRDNEAYRRALELKEAYGAR